MKLYDTPLAPNPRRVRWFMAEKGIEDIEVITLNLIEGTHKQPEYLEKAGLPNVPMLEMDDGTCITESVAICRYLEAVHPTPPLFGSDPASKGKIEMWNRRMENEVFATIGNVTLHTNEFFKERVIQVPAFAEAQRKMIPGKWAWLDREMNDGRPYLAGDEFSMADISGMVTLWLSEVFSYEVPADLPNVQRWNERLRQRPSWNA